ncbi:hypothetical protein F4774DRAFT_204232 [Daldinia eschscholtzii]|nr:hypothetical protein F4774DRAFT_204232 [Daldinia eschscholtzii]
MYVCVCVYVYVGITIVQSRPVYSPSILHARQQHTIGRFYIVRPMYVCMYVHMYIQYSYTCNPHTIYIERIIISTNTTTYYIPPPLLPIQGMGGFFSPLSRSPSPGIMYDMVRSVRYEVTDPCKPFNRRFLLCVRTYAN